MGLFDFLKTKDAVPYQKIHEELDRFTEASLAMPKLNNPFLLNDKNNHPMIFGYFTGVMDYMAKKYQLTDKEKLKIYTQYLSKNFAENNEESAKALVKYSDEVSKTDEGDHYALRGKLAMKKWIAGGPMAAYAPMGLIKILND